MRCPTLTELPLPPEGRTGWPWTEGSPLAPDFVSKGEFWPRVTIVTPSYNQENFIEETIRSVLLQGYPDLEYIIIDGGSTDRSGEIIRKYSPWLRFWVSEPDNGQAEAINKGFRYSSGDILGYLNSDDIYFPSALGKLVRQSMSVVDGWSAPCILAAPVQDFSESEILDCHSNHSFGRPHQWLDGGVSLHQPGVLWTKALWMKCGPFREDLCFMFDRYFFSVACILEANFIFSAETLAGFRVHEGSKTYKHLLVEDRFSAEWQFIKTLLEIKLTLRQKAILWMNRELVENWRLVEEALSSQPNHISDFMPLIERLKKRPWWILHRPVAGALLRCVRLAIH